MNNWQYVTVVYDNRNMQMYINGILNNATSFTDSIYGYTSDLFIGGTTGYTFNGDVDEVMIFNRTLTGTEISGMYDATK
jgi:hypothetical protein